MKNTTYKRILSAVLAIVLFVTNFSVVTFASNEFSIASEGSQVSRVKVSENGNLTVSAEYLPENCGYQWQIKIPGTKQWVDIYGQTQQELNLTYALVGNLLDGNRSAYVRCAAMCGGAAEEYTDDLLVMITDPVEIPVTIAELTAPAPLPAPVVEIPEEEYYIPETEPVVEETAEPTEEETLPEETEASEEETVESQEEETVPETETVTEEEIQETTSPAETEAEEEVVVPSEEATEVSEEATDTLEQTQPAKLRSAAPRSADPLIDDNTTVFTVTINYVYADGLDENGDPSETEIGSQYAGQLVALPHIQDVPQGELPDIVVVPSPECVGYTAGQATVKWADIIGEGGIQGNREINIEYSPAMVSYTVRHYHQNIDNDEYVFVETSLESALTESMTNENDATNPHKEYVGFEALDHYPEQVAADSSTVIDIYYDRNYVLMSFELDGGYGVLPIYARYETPISIAEPTKTGWTFAGWYDAPGEDANPVDIDAKMPANKVTYYAHWTPNSTGISYSVAYWIKDTNANGEEELTYIKTDTYDNVQAGTPVVGKDDICGTEVHVHDETCTFCNIEPHTHGDECISCVIENHTHSLYCIDSISGNGSVGDADMNAIQNANSNGDFDPDAIYIYFIQGSSDKNPGNIRYWPKFYINGKYFTIKINYNDTVSSIQTWINGQRVEGTSGGLDAIRYQVAPSKIVCNKDEHTHIDSCITCGKPVHIHDTPCYNCGETFHSHNSTCKPVISKELEYLYSDPDTTVKGDSSTVMNVYYKYKTYTIRYVYARKTSDGSYWIAKFTHEGGFDDCDWTFVGRDESILPDVNDPSNKTTDTNRPQFKHTGEDGECTYYYISLTAKFGENISKFWPADNIGNIESGGTTWRFGSWASAPGTPYRKLSTLNANVVGPYPLMSAEMIVDNPVKLEDGSYLAQNMIAWWSPDPVGPHSYHNYFEILPGELTEDQKNLVQATPTVINGKTYVKYGDNIYKLEKTETFAVAHNGSTRVDPLEYTGFTWTKNNKDNLGNSNLSKDNPDCPFKESPCAYCNVFYYNRNTHYLKFYNYDQWLMQGDGVLLPYGTDLTKYDQGTEGNPGATPIVLSKYPEKLEANAYTFDGWCTTSDCHPDSKLTEEDWENLTMPDSDLTLYARWAKNVYQVELYPGESHVQGGQPFDTLHPEHNGTAKDDLPDLDALKEQYGTDQEFIGWFYKYNGMELQYDPANTVVTADMVVYAKWRSTKMKEVEISYIIRNLDGTITEVADTETLMLRVGQARTFEAKTGNDLYEEYRGSCFPTVSSHSITPTNESGKITFQFEYTESLLVPYRVEFKVKEQDGTLRPAFQLDNNGKIIFIEVGQWDDDYQEYVEDHTDNPKAAVMEFFLPDVLGDSYELPDGYQPNALKVRHIIVPNTDNPGELSNENIIQFVYTYDPSVTLAKYLIQHFVENGDGYDLHSFQNMESTKNTTASANAISIQGYTFNAAVTNEKKQSGTTLNGTTLSGTIAANNSLELNFYYTINCYPYQILYLEEGTNVQLKPKKTTDEHGNLLMDKYGAKVTEDAPEIDGYEVVGEATKSIYIQMEANPDIANVNTITFLYRKKTADLVVTKTVKEDIYQSEAEKLSQENKDMLANQEFAFTLHSDVGFLSQVYDYTIKNADDSIVTEGKIQKKDDFNLNPILIKGGQKIVFHDLPMGEYKVREKNEIGYLTTIGDSTTPASEAIVNLETTDETKQVDFVNTFPFYTGDLVIKKTVMDGDQSVSTNRTYKVKITLKPAKEALGIDRVITFVNAAGNPYKDENGNPRTLTVKAVTGDTVDPVGFTVDVPAGDEVKLKGVPAGTFTAEEIPNEATDSIENYYTVRHNVRLHAEDSTNTNPGSSIGEVTPIEIHGGHATNVIFRNSLKRGSLTIKKTVTQEFTGDSWKSDTFTFTVTGTTELPDGIYTVKIGSESKSVIVTGGQLSFTYDIAVEKSDDDTLTEWTESVTFTNLPAGKYTVEETSSVNGLDKYTVTAPTGSQLVNDASSATFAFTNTFKRTTGSLKVSKVILLVEDSYMDVNQEFTFTVQLSDKPLTGTYTCQIKSTNDSDKLDDDTEVEGSKKSVTADEGSLTFTLKHNQYILIEGLPVGKYIVTEAQVPGYQSTFANESQLAFTPAVGNVTIETGKLATLICKNRFPVYFGDLTIYQKDAESTKETIKTGIYEVRDMANTLVATVMITGESSVTLHRLALGTYKVRELTGDWTWTHELVGESSCEVEIKADTENTVTFTQTSQTVDWLHAETRHIPENP